MKVSVIFIFYHEQELNPLMLYYAKEAQMELITLFLFIPILFSILDNRVALLKYTLKKEFHELIFHA